jgi:sugar O-acyltransferase (sialic acid O-acetyltransferase NeuD family)
MKKIVLIGGGGHCKSCIEVIESTGLYQIAGILEKETTETKVLGYSIIGDDNQIPVLAKQGFEFLITVGQINKFDLRIKLAQIVVNAGGKLATIFAKTAQVSKHAFVGEGTIIMHQAFVNADVNIGSNCIINTGAKVEHDVKIGNNCHVSVNAVLNGSVTLGNNCFIGSSAVIFQNAEIEPNTIIGAGTLVRKSLKKEGVYLGNPIFKLK